MADLAQLSFELERFEWAADDRLEVAGRWYGVRGRRFMRPTLHVRAGGRRRRMIALLDHKPWPADEDTRWVAAFAWRGAREEVTAARLEVTPDIVLELPTPGATEPGTTLTPRPRPTRADIAPRPPAPGAAGAGTPPPPPPPPPPGGPRPGAPGPPPPTSAPPPGRPPWPSPPPPTSRRPPRGPPPPTRPPRTTSRWR